MGGIKNVRRGVEPANALRKLPVTLYHREEQMAMDSWIEVYEYLVTVMRDAERRADFYRQETERLKDRWPSSLSGWRLRATF